MKNVLFQFRLVLGLLILMGVGQVKAKVLLLHRLVST